MKDRRQDPDVPARMADAVRTLLLGIGEDPEREGLVRTPERVARALQFLTQGHDTTVEEVVNGAIFHDDYDEMVLVRDIEVFSLCEHHLLPFVGKAHVAYIPKGRVIGLSKIPRIVNLYSRRLQLQERLTNEVAHALVEVLRPRGVGVVIEAQHMCMMMRGVEKQHSTATTSAMLGGFRHDERTRAEFLSLIARPSA